MSKVRLSAWRSAGGYTRKGSGTSQPTCSFFDPKRNSVQRRAVNKDLHANRWGSSVGEHLQPGESYLSGALPGTQGFRS